MCLWLQIVRPKDSLDKQKSAKGLNNMQLAPLNLSGPARA